MKKLMLIMAMMTCLGLQATDKVYIDSKELNFKHDTFRIHVGGNEWIRTNTVHRDQSGLYTFESDILRNHIKMGYEKEWKCPYCHRYWPLNQPCQNGNCPSKYR